MKYIKLLSMLLLVGILPFIATSCGSDDDNPENPEEKEKEVELYVHVYDYETGEPIQNVDVDFYQFGKVCTDNTGTLGIALCSSKYDKVETGHMNIVIDDPKYRLFMKDGTLNEGKNEWDAYLELAGTNTSPKDPSYLKLSLESVEDLYGTLKIKMGYYIHHVRVFASNDGNFDSWVDYNNPDHGDESKIFTQEITYNNLAPDTEYTFKVVAYSDITRLFEKTISVTTKELSHRSSSSASIVDFVSIHDGIAAKLSKDKDIYVACYEADKVPSNEKTIIKDAISSGKLLENSVIAYVSGLKEKTKYRLFVIPAEKIKIPNSEYYTFYPGKLASIDITTKHTESSYLAISLSKKEKDYVDYMIRQGRIDDPLYSFRVVNISNFELYDHLPKVALAALCIDAPYHNFNTNILPFPPEEFTWSGLDLSTWYGIVALGYYDSYGKNNTGSAARYIFKYGKYGVSSTGVSRSSSNEQGIIFGSIDENMLRDVKPF